MERPNVNESRALFWSNRQVWPGNYLNRIFLGWAVDMIGQKLFGDQWTGHEAERPPIQPLPPFQLAQPLSPLADGALRSVLLEWGLWSREEIDTEPRLTEAEYNVARDLVQAKLMPEVDARLLRWTEAIATLQKGLIAGHVVSVLQDWNGQQFSDPLPRECWILHDPLATHRRFATCSIQCDDPSYSMWPSATRSPRLIYVEGGSLKGFLDGPVTDFLAAIQGEAPQASSVQVTSIADTPSRTMKETLKLARAWLKEKGHPDLTRQEADELLKRLHQSTKQQRATVYRIIPAREKRRPMRLLLNRSKELADCHKYLSGN